VPVNCAAIPAGLGESELFGHVAGSFTGARGKSVGLFQRAHRGTLFLDEIGEMPLELQPKLLRALAKGEVRPVGAAETTHVDVRVVAATNRDLAAAAGKDEFRRDLYARLAGFTIRVPPLRDRHEDIVMLANRFLAAHAAPPLAVDAAEALVLHPWPLNVRELEQAMAVAAVHARGADAVRRKHIALADPGGAAPGPAGESAADGAGRSEGPDKAELEELLARFAGNVAQVAAHLRKDRAQIYRWLKRYAIEPGSYRND
jgi:transcriptional regulator with PAS, ATPase and Fis domain